MQILRTLPSPCRTQVKANLADQTTALVRVVCFRSFSLAAISRPITSENQIPKCVI